MTKTEFGRRLIGEVIRVDDKVVHETITAQQLIDYYYMKHVMALALQPKKIVEIGVRAGYSAWSFLTACPDAEYLGLDAWNCQHGGEPEEWCRPWAVSLLSPFKARIETRDTQQHHGIEPADFYHIDGDHTKEGARHDLDVCWSALGVGSLLIDDVDYIPEVGQAVDAFIMAKGCPCTQHLHSIRGEMLIHKGRSAVNPWLSYAL